MAVEWVKFSRSLAFAAGPAAENFRIDVSLREGMPPRILLADEVAGEVRRLLRRPAWRRTFLIGPFTSRIDPALGGMREEDIAFIEGVHQFYDGLGMDCYSAFRREEYGQLGIADEDATLLDALAIRTSHVLTVLPGSSLSAGAWEEIRYGGALGRSFLFLFRRGEEVKFQETLRSLIANLSTHPFLVFATFRNNQDLFEQMKMVWGYVAKEPVTEDNWNDYVKSLLQKPEFERFKF